MMESDELSELSPLSDPTARDVESKSGEGGGITKVVYTIDG